MALNFIAFFAINLIDRVFMIKLLNGYGLTVCTYILAKTNRLSAIEIIKKIEHYQITRWT